MHSIIIWQCRSSFGLFVTVNWYKINYMNTKIDSYNFLSDELGCMIYGWQASDRQLFDIVLFCWHGLGFIQISYFCSPIKFNKENVLKLKCSKPTNISKFSMPGYQDLENWLHTSVPSCLHCMHHAPLSYWAQMDTDRHRPLIDDIIMFQQQDQRGGR